MARTPSPRGTSPLPKSRKALTAAALAVALTAAIAPASAGAEGWSGSFSLDYTSENYDHFAGQVELSGSEFLGGPTRSTPPDPDLDGTSSWRMHGGVAGSYSQQLNDCSITAEPDPKFEKRPAGVGGDYTYNQSLIMFGPPPPSESGAYILNHMGLHMRGTIACIGDQPSEYNETGIPIPDLEGEGGTPIHPLNLRLPLAGDRGPLKLEGGALRWQGTQQLTYQSTDPDMDGPGTGFKTANWTYDLRYTPFDPAGCTLRAKRKQHFLDGVVAFKVVGDEGGCKAKLTAAKVKIGKKGGGAVTKKTPSAEVAPGSDWALVLPYPANLIEKIFKALKNDKKVRAKATFKLNGQQASASSKIVK